MTKIIRTTIKNGKQTSHKNIFKGTSNECKLAVELMMHPSQYYMIEIIGTKRHVIIGEQR